ncbi:hypothetical protein D3C76_876240 [compost metagenome]
MDAIIVINSRGYEYCLSYTFYYPYYFPVDHAVVTYLKCTGIQACISEQLFETGAMKDGETCINENDPFEFLVGLVR